MNEEIFDPEKALDPFDAAFNWEAAAESVTMDDQAFLDSDEYGHAGNLGHGERGEEN